MIKHKKFGKRFLLQSILEYKKKYFILLLGTFNPLVERKLYNFTLQTINILSNNVNLNYILE